MSRRNRNRRSSRPLGRATEAQRTPVVHVYAREAWGDLIDYQDYAPSEAFLNTNTLDGPNFSVDARADGRDGNRVWTEHDLRHKRALSRWLFDQPIGKSALSKLVNYTIGTGFAYRCDPKRNRGPAAQSLAGMIQDVIDEFLETNCWILDRDREKFERKVVDGEAAILLANGPGGFEDMPRVRFVEPEQIGEPQNKQQLEDELECSYPSSWSFGVHTPAGDTENVLGFYVRWSSSEADADYVPASVLLHSKRNVNAATKRGLPDAFSPRTHLQNAESLLQNLATAAAVQTQIAYVREHSAGTSSTSIQSFADNKAQNFRRERSASGGSRDIPVQQKRRGTVVDVREGLAYKPGPMSDGPAALAYADLMNVCIRIAGGVWDMPEYMLTGDASNANYSSTLVAESPFVKGRVVDQQREAERDRKMLWAVIDRCRNRLGEFSDLPIAELQKLVNIVVEPPQVAARNEAEQTNQRKTLHEGGVLSLRTWSSQEGLDFEQEQANIQKEPKPAPAAPFGTGGQPSPQFGQPPRPARESVGDALPFFRYP